MENKTSISVLDHFQAVEFNPEYFHQGLITLENFYHSPEAALSLFNTEKIDYPKKRGRKCLRPNNPTKTEVMDKY